MLSCSTTHIEFRKTLKFMKKFYVIEENFDMIALSETRLKRCTDTFRNRSSPGFGGVIGVYIRKSFPFQCIEEVSFVNGETESISTKIDFGKCSKVKVNIYRPPDAASML